MRRLLIGACVLLALAARVEAKDLYVDAVRGNDMTTYAANSAATPWRSMGRSLWGTTNRESRNGAEAAQAGDLVHVLGSAPGAPPVVYTFPGKANRWDVAAFSENSGTAAASIKWQAEGQVELALSSLSGPIFGCHMRDYLTFEGFSVPERSAHPSSPDTGVAVVHESNGCALGFNRIDGNGVGHGELDNHPGIRVESARNVRLYSNRITNVRTAQTNPHNGAAIQTYQIGYFVFENNEIWNTGAGIFIKGGPSVPAVQDQGGIIRNNYIHDMPADGSAIALHAGANGTAAHPIIVTNNIVVDAWFGMRLWKFADADPFNTPMNIQIRNNTIVRAHSCLFLDQLPTLQTGHVFERNVCAAASYLPYEWNAPTNAPQTQIRANFNLASLAASNGGGFWATVTSGANYALAAWRTASGQDAGSVIADPGFVSATDFHLTATSAARALGAGAYVTGNEVIGPVGAVVAPPPPPPAVDCVLSAPTVTLGPLVPTSCPATGQQSRTDSWTRIVVTPASNGGAACGPLTGTTANTVACTYVPPPPPPPVVPGVRLDCTSIVSVTKGAPYANGDERWTIRGVCVEKPAGTVTGPPR